MRGNLAWKLHSASGQAPDLGFSYATYFFVQHFNNNAGEKIFSLVVEYDYTMYLEYDYHL